MWVTATLLVLALQAGISPVLEFPAAGDPGAHDEFILGVIALHSSAYVDAAEHFRAAAKLDPAFVMAYWGEAMTFNHPFWNQQDIAGARRSLLKLGPTRAARAAKARSVRERGYLNAVEILYGEGDRDRRDFQFADAMKKLAFDNPADYEAAAFYVLALLSSRRAGDQTYPQTQVTAAAILHSILEKYPDHPGALHYLMHTYDDPEHAAHALDAARKYEKVAVPDSSFHAIHMPSHVYAQLGMWADVVRTNQEAFDASDRWVKSKKLPLAGRDYHSLDYLHYAQMQLGQYRKARETLSGFAGTNAQAAVMAARFAIETGDWDVLGSFPANNAIPELLFARGLAAIQKADIEGARRVSSTLDSLIQADLAASRRVHASMVDLLMKLLGSRIALAERRLVDADRLASEALQLEHGIDIPAELNGIVKPAAEFFGEILLETKRNGEAAAQFAASLQQSPKRALSMLGLARATGERRAYQELADMWSDADPEEPVVREVRNFLRQDAFHLHLRH